MRDEIIKILETKGSLPPFPDLLIKIQKKLRDPYSGIPDVSKLIELDPVLVGNILKIANSAYYNRGMGEVTTLSVAMNKLGLTNIKHLVYTLKLMKLFSDSTVFDYYSFWHHSLSVATCSQKLCRHARLSDTTRDIAYLSSIMHDVGIMVFAYLIPERYEPFVRNLTAKPLPLDQQELTAFNIHHQELGALFMKKWWDVDPDIIVAVEQHHTPHKYQGDRNILQAIRIVNISNRICNSTGITNGIECFHEGIADAPWEEVGLSKSDIDPLVDSINEEIYESLKILGFG